MTPSPIMTGLDVVTQDASVIGRRDWALLANHAAVTATLDPARIALASARAPKLLFAPEHGLEGVAQDMEGVDDQHDALTGLPVRSLYGWQAATLSPRDEDLEHLDLVVVDLPDIGSRYYTFAATMDFMMAACEARGVAMLVLDRPNPIGGIQREGGMVQAGCESFVSQLPTPIRHGLTLGELAMLLKRHRYPGLELEIALCRGWSRRLWWDETGLPWVPPSPNMPSLETAALYPGLCLIEATELSEGRGTTRPFHLIGAPWIDGARLVEALRSHQRPGCAFRPAAFRPMFQKHAGAICGGVELHVTDRNSLNSLELGCTLITTIRQLYPDDFAWRQAPYEFVADTPALDLLSGSPALREHIESDTTLDPLFADWAKDVRSFEETLDGIMIYHE